MDSADPKIAVPRLVRSAPGMLENSLHSLWPVDQTPCFQGLLAAIDDADCQLRVNPDASESQPAEATILTRAANLFVQLPHRYPRGE
jgi:hypothetical protein